MNSFPFFIEFEKTRFPSGFYQEKLKKTKICNFKLRTLKGGENAKKQVKCAES